MHRTCYALCDDSDARTIGAHTNPAPLSPPVATSTSHHAHCMSGCAEVPGGADGGVVFCVMRAAKLLSPPIRRLRRIEIESSEMRDMRLKRVPHSRHKAITSERICDADATHPASLHPAPIQHELCRSCYVCVCVCVWN